jgi:hypothetical protein
MMMMMMLLQQLQLYLLCCATDKDNYRQQHPAVMAIQTKLQQQNLQARPSLPHPDEPLHSKCMSQHARAGCGTQLAAAWLTSCQPIF